MAPNREIDVVAAGHLCLDLIPAFTLEGRAERITDVLIPGKMINMGRCVVAGGGPVTNAGVSIKRLGPRVELIGKCGDDDYGKLLLRWYEEHEGHFRGLHMVAGESTSYTIAICIPGIDRFYLHHCGANDTFGLEDMDFDIVGQSKVMLFGYPPWMARLYRNTGAELTAILGRTKELGTTTALDLSIPDMDSEAGQLDWRAILERWIPLTDIMAPSAEEVYFFLFHDRFLARKAELSDRDVLLDHMTYEEFRAIADEMLALGTAIALIKCGVRGLYVKTAPADRLEKLGAARPADVEQWADREIWSPVYEEERFVGALGSGDSAIAGFLSALVWGHSLEDCLRYGNAAGSMNVTVPDGLSWNRGFDDLTRRLDAGWAQKILDVDRDAWPCEVCRP
jgi:sugar/nucleoside kinase (ribokinase family)